MTTTMTKLAGTTTILLPEEKESYNVYNVNSDNNKYTNNNSTDNTIGKILVLKLL
jgi:hypothetical protein